MWTAAEGCGDLQQPVPRQLVPRLRLVAEVCGGAGWRGSAPARAPREIRAAAAAAASWCACNSPSPSSPPRIDTLRSGSDSGPHPRHWVFEGSADGAEWTASSCVLKICPMRAWTAGSRKDAHPRELLEVLLAPTSIELVNLMETQKLTDATGQALGGSSESAAQDHDADGAQVTSPGTPVSILLVILPPQRAIVGACGWWSAFFVSTLSSLRGPGDV